LTYPVGWVAENPMLSIMPLHTITAIFGEQGLRERLALETARIPDPVDRQQVAGALELGARLHASDRRQREPYVNHLLRVALRITVHYGVRDPDVICAALLHDSVEDHAEVLSADGHPGAFAALAGTYGTRVAELVAAVTNPVYAPGRDRDDQYRDHVIRSLFECPWARVIKVSDFTDNAVGLIYTTGEKAIRLARKYGPLVPALEELVAQPDTPLAKDAKDLILRQLRKATSRCNAIIVATSGVIPLRER
jgi:hypothetical protein